MQADDIGDSGYSHENVYHCVCLITYEIVQIDKHESAFGLSILQRPVYYKCPKAYVIMSRYPFYELYVHVLSEVMGIFKLEVIQRSKQLLTKDGEVNAVSIAQQVESDIVATMGIPIMLPSAAKFLDLLFGINLYDAARRADNQFVINNGMCRLSQRLPHSPVELQKKALMWHMPVLLSLLEKADPAKQILNILANLILEKSIIVVGKSSEDPD